MYFFYCRKALLLLKKKRYQDQLVDKTESQISNLELMVRVPDVTPFNSVISGRLYYHDIL